MDVKFRIAQTTPEFNDGAMLFQEYANYIGIDLSFQNFNDELNNVSKQYSQPTGALLLAYHLDEAMGCVAVRALDATTAELKRMFIRPQYQGQKLGQRMLHQIIAIAKELGYTTIRLDTLPTMKGALALYRQFGFYEIAPYRFNPIEGTVYMEKIL